MQFSEYSKKYLVEKRGMEEQYLSKDMIYDLRKELNNRIEMLICPRYTIVEEMIREAGDYLAGMKRQVEELEREQRKRESACRRYYDKVKELRENGGSEEEIAFIYSCINHEYEEKKIISEKKKEMKQQISNLRYKEQWREDYSSIADKRIYSAVNDAERKLYNLLLDEISFVGEVSNGKKIKKGEWEVLSLDVREQLLQYLSELSEENPKRWPFKEEDLQEIRMKLMQSQEYRNMVRRDELRVYIKNHDVVELLDDKMFNKLYGIVFGKGKSSRK